MAGTAAAEIATKASPANGSAYRCPPPIHRPWWHSVGKFALVLAAHGALLAWASQTRPAPEPEAPLIRIDLRTLALAPPPAPKPLPVAAPRPAPTPPKARRPQALPPPPVLTAASQAAVPTFAVAPQPPVAAIPAKEIAAPVAVPIAVPAPAPPLPVSAARFDADYLHNPAPAYPALSRRMHEEGKVLLTVRVSPQGLAESVTLRQSSGSSRLDEAAQEAVRHWRFVPARRGDDAIAASVVVPVVFRLDS